MLLQYIWESVLKAATLCLPDAELHNSQNWNGFLLPYLAHE